jgi:hypothetical protein
LWDPKRVNSVPYGDVSKWLQGAGFVLVARLRLPYALQVQQAFAADLTRVGLPMAPPIQRSARARLYCPCGDGKCVLLAEREPGAHLFATRDGHRFVVTFEFVIDIKSRLSEAIENWEKREAFLREKGGGKSAEAAHTAADTLRHLRTQHDVALRIRVPFVPPAAGESAPLDDLPITIQFGGEVAGTYERNSRCWFICWRSN